MNDKLKTFTSLSDEHPKDKEMVIFIAIFENYNIYITDPYCGFMLNGKFMRWPHSQPPTHFKRIWN